MSDLHNKIFVRQYRNLQDNSKIVSVKRFLYRTGIELADTYTVQTILITIVDSSEVYSGKIRKDAEKYKNTLAYNPISIIIDSDTISVGDEVYNHIMELWKPIELDFDNMLKNSNQILDKIINLEVFNKINNE